MPSYFDGGLQAAGWRAAGFRTAGKEGGASYAAGGGVPYDMRMDPMFGRSAFVCDDPSLVVLYAVRGTRAYAAALQEVDATGNAMCTIANRLTAWSEAVADELGMGVAEVMLPLLLLLRSPWVTADVDIRDEHLDRECLTALRAAYHSC